MKLLYKEYKIFNKKTRKEVFYIKTETKVVPSKTKEEILDQLYLSAYDLKIIIPSLSYNTAIKYIKQARFEMDERQFFVPEGKTLIALTKIIRKKFGF